MKKIIVFLIDGCSTEYIEGADLPNIKAIIKQGFYKRGSGVIPSVTNVNNVSIVTGSFPCEHGITANYHYHPDRGVYEYMESSEYLMTETVFEKVKKQGMSSAVLTSKSKLLNLLKKGADVCFSAENPPREYIDALAEPPAVYSTDINIWLLKAALYLIKKQSPDVIYVSTTDYAMHKYAPDEEPSIRHMKGLDSVIGEICAQEPGREVFITADHGMNAKHKAVNIQLLLNRYGIDAVAVPIIKDRYTAHHQNMGGAAYIHLKNNSSAQIKEAMAILKESDWIDEVYENAEAAREFRLYPSRTGDIFILAKKDIVFADIDSVETDVNIRSHGSRHESVVPIIGNRPCGEKFNYNVDIFAKTLI